jgi:hypothetical protein
LLTEKDLKNTLNLVSFCLDNDSFPNATLLTDIATALLFDYEQSVYKLRVETQEHFIRVGRRLLSGRALERLTDASIRNVKTEATSLLFLCEGLEVFEALDIVKHDTRRLLLERIKNIVQKDEFKVKNLQYLIGFYPNKIRAKAYEQLVDIAIQKVVQN